MGNKIRQHSFSFEVVTVNRRGEIIRRETKQAKYFTETICSGNESKSIGLDMVYIPGGTFIMGSTDEEVEYALQQVQFNIYNTEKPHHQVTVPSFFIGKYPVTQQQWRAVAALPKVNRDLEPTNLKDNLPVEDACWYDAVEFCDRLSQHTGKPYRLCSEAEWEYACRAGTTTPFHFGETMTTELANTRSDDTFADEEPGESRGETIPVGSLGGANNFGLYDMHGNVLEWCLDDWHDNYQGAPTDGRAWFDNNDPLAQKQGEAVMRSGSWNSVYPTCRCASRIGWDRGYDGLSNTDSPVNSFGFRIACTVEEWI
jgi:formylglycine-generating enzyme required for sulfatase activity